jgi:hypothetical protein
VDDLGATAARVGALALAGTSAAARTGVHPAPLSAASVASANGRTLTQRVGVVENARNNDGTTTSTWIASTRP